jgi:hypothetical protein
MNNEGIFAKNTGKHGENQGKSADPVVAEICLTQRIYLLTLTNGSLGQKRGVNSDSVNQGSNPCPPAII